MSALENFTPLELALLAIIITGYIYHRRSLQNHTNNSPSETGSQTDSSKLLPRKCYISSKTQTLGKVEDKTDKSNPYGKIVLCEGDQSELEDDYIEYEEQFDYFAKAYTELTESEKRVRLGLLIHSGTGLLDVLRPQGIVREPLPDQNPSPQAGLLARMSTALPQVIRPGKGEVEENTRVILAAFCKIFKDKYAAGFSVMGKQGSEAIDLFVCQDSVSKDEREDASNRTTGVKDDHGDRFKVPRLQNQAKSASGSVSVEGHLEAAIKAKGQIDHFVAVTDILNSYQLATETEEKLQIRDVLQRYVLFCCRDEMEMRFNLSYEVVKGKEGYKSPFRLKDTFTRIYFSERTTKDIRWPSQKDLEAFRLDERSLQACFDECKVEFRFTPDNFIDLDRHSIATFHTFFTRLLTLVDCSLRYLDPENLRTLSADKTVPPFLRKHDEKSRAISLKAFAKTQAHLQAFGDLVLRSRSFQIYLHQPEVKAALRKKYTYASYGSYGAEQTWNARVLKQIEAMPRTFNEYKAAPIEGIKAWIKVVTEHFEACSTVLDRLRTPVTLTILQSPEVKPSGSGLHLGFAKVISAVESLSSIGEEKPGLWQRLHTWATQRKCVKDHRGELRRLGEWDVLSDSWGCGHYHSTALFACLRSLTETDVNRVELEDKDRETFIFVINQLKSCSPFIASTHRVCQACHLYNQHIPSSGQASAVIPSNLGLMEKWAAPPWETRLPVLQSMWEEIQQTIISVLKEEKLWDIHEWNLVEDARKEAEEKRLKESLKLQEYWNRRNNYTEDGDIILPWKKGDEPASEADSSDGKDSSEDSEESSEDSSEDSEDSDSEASVLPWEEEDEAAPEDSSDDGDSGVDLEDSDSSL